MDAGDGGHAQQVQSQPGEKDDPRRHTERHRGIISGKVKGWGGERQHVRSLLEPLAVFGQTQPAPGKGEYGYAGGHQPTDSPAENWQRQYTPNPHGRQQQASGDLR